MSQIGFFGGSGGGGGGTLNTLTGNTGTATASAGNINVIGDTGANITTTGSGDDLTIAVSGNTDHALVVGNSTGSLDSLAVAIDGQIPIGSTGANPVISTITAGSGISITNGAGSITIAASGGGTNPAFGYYASSTQSNVTGDATLYTVIFDTQLYDTTSSFDGISTFTAPVTGLYCFNTIIYLQGINVAHTIAALYFINPVVSGLILDVNPFNMADSNANLVVNGGYHMFLNALDTVQVQVIVIGGTKTVSINGGTGSPAAITTMFNGFLVS